MPQPGLQWTDQIAVKVGGSNLDHKWMDNLIEVVVDSSLHLPDMVIMHFNDTDNFDLMDSGPFEVGKEIEVQLPQDETSSTTIKVFKGEITAIEPNFGREIAATLTVRGYSKGHRLNRNTNIKVYKDMTDGDMVKKIAGEHGLSPKVEDPGQKYDYVYQHSQTDMEFLLQRAQRVGYEVFVEDNDLYFRKPKGARGSATLEWGKELRAFKPRMTVWRQVSAVKVRGWDPEKKKEIIGQASSTEASPKVDMGKGAQAASKIPGKTEEIIVRRPVYTQREADLLAQALLDEINAGFIEADGVAVGNPNLKAGVKVTINKISKKFSGQYVISAARHIYSPEGYETEFTVQGVRPRLMTDLIESQSEFSDTDRFWNGVVPAIVDNINDPQNKGRVELRYPWLDDTQKTGWARVATIGAGNNRGFLWMPEVGDEVLVAFEHGDFNRPYIIGTLWNGKDKPPEDWGTAVKSNKSEVRMMKSREGHVIKMVDGPSEQYIEIVDAQKGTTIKLDAKTNKLSIESKDEISVKTSTSMKVTTSSNMDIDSTGNITINSKGNVKVSGMGNVEVTATGPLTLKGAVVNIN